MPLFSPRFSLECPAPLFVMSSLYYITGPEESCMLQCPRLCTELRPHFSRQLNCAPGGAYLPRSREAYASFHWDSSGRKYTTWLGDSHYNHPILLRLSFMNESLDQGELHGIIVSPLQPHHQWITKTATSCSREKLQDKLMKVSLGLQWSWATWLG